MVYMFQTESSLRLPTSTHLSSQCRYHENHRRVAVRKAYSVERKMYLAEQRRKRMVNVKSHVNLIHTTSIPDRIPLFNMLKKPQRYLHNSPLSKPVRLSELHTLAFAYKTSFY